MASKKNEAYIEFKANTSEFQKGIKQMNAELKTATNELRLNATQLKGAGDSVDLLSERQSILQKELAASAQKVELTEKSLAECEATLGKNSKEYESLNNAVIAAKNQQQAIQNELDQTADKLAKISTENKQAATSFGQLADKIDEQESELSALKKEYANVALEQGQSSKEAQALAKKIDSLSTELNENKKTLKDAEEAADEFDNTLEDLGESAEEASEGFTVMKGAMADLLADGVSALADGLVNVTKEAFTMATDIDKATNTFIAKTGATVEEAKKFEDIMTSIYNNNFGESFEDISEAMSTVKASLGELDDGDLQTITEHAFTLRDTFDFEVNESVRSAKMLMDQFGLTGEQAYNLIAQGAQHGLNAQGDMLDIINEYSVHFEQLGFDGEEMFNILVSGAENGAFSLDKVGDAVKEFGIRTKDGSDATKEAFTSLGLDADEMSAAFAKGGDDATKAFINVNRALASVEDPLEQGQLGVSLYGTMWEDLGTTAVTALVEYGDQFNAANETMQSLNDIKYDDLGSALEGIKRNLQTSVAQPLKDEVLPTVSEFIEGFDWSGFGQLAGDAFGALAKGAVAVAEGIMNATQWLNEHRGVVATVATVIGILTTAITAYNIVQGIKTAMDAANVTTVWALVSAHIAQAAAAMAALAPYVLIVAAIAAVIAIIVLCIKHWDKIKEKITEVAKKVKEKVTEIKNQITEKLNAAKQKAVEIFNNIKNGISQKINEAKNKVVEVFNNIKNAISQKLNEAKNKVNEIFNNIKNAISNKLTEAKNKVSSIFNNIKSTMQNIINNAKNAVVNVFSNLSSNVTSKINSLKSSVSNTFNNIKNAILTPIENARDKVKGIVDRIVSFFSNMKISLPKIKLPHLTISGSFSLNPPSVPKIGVQWYAKGGFFNKPTILSGLGEAGPEYALPLNERSLAPLAVMLNKLTATGENGLGDMLASRFDSAVDRLTERLERLEMSVNIDGERVATATASHNDANSGARAQLAGRGLSLA